MIRIILRKTVSDILDAPGYRNTRVTGMSLGEILDLPKDTPVVKYEAYRNDRDYMLETHHYIEFEDEDAGAAALFKLRYM